ncbi:MAG TPA: DinB family protein [Gemmatimonadales bacterium]|nr:DinB family protein [Gemmatimonadales bacterium]
MSASPEAWLAGPLPGVIALLQPAAHAIEQVRRDLPPLLRTLSVERIWARPGTSASIGYHAVHLAGSLDRLFTYARGAALTDEQRDALARERAIDEEQPEMERIIALLEGALGAALEQLGRTSEEELIVHREVGRGRAPSTTLGLLFHGAEHSARHAGQIVTLVRVTERA